MKKFKYYLGMVISLLLMIFIIIAFGFCIYEEVQDFKGISLDEVLIILAITVWSVSLYYFLKWCFNGK